MAGPPRSVRFGSVTMRTIPAACDAGNDGVGEEFALREVGIGQVGVWCMGSHGESQCGNLEKCTEMESV